MPTGMSCFLSPPPRLGALWSVAGLNPNGADAPDLPSHHVRCARRPFGTVRPDLTHRLNLSRPRSPLDTYSWTRFVTRGLAVAPLCSRRCLDSARDFQISVNCQGQRTFVRIKTTPLSDDWRLHQDGERGSHRVFCFTARSHCDPGSQWTCRLRHLGEHRSA